MKLIKLSILVAMLAMGAFTAHPSSATPGACHSSYCAVRVWWDGEYRVTEVQNPDGTWTEQDRYWAPKEK